MQIDQLPFLRLLQLADSALPIGTAAHSFGLESLTADEYLTASQLPMFFHDYLNEAGTLEAAFCRLSYALSLDQDQDQDQAAFADTWCNFNSRLSAFKTARESRQASATLGRRFLQLVASLESDLSLTRLALSEARTRRIDIHYSIAFGLVGGLLQVTEDGVVLAYLQQTLNGLISACQRLLPLGQSQASTILWQLKPALIEVAQKSRYFAQHPDEIVTFTPLLDIGSMRHPELTTRLFIS